MRATLRQSLRHPADLSAWWEELPARRRGWLRWLLFEPGQGWLRWKSDDREKWGGSWALEPPEFYVVAPPARRVAWWLSCRLHGAHNERLSYWWALFRDDDRKRGVW